MVLRPFEKCIVLTEFSRKSYLCCGRYNEHVKSAMVIEIQLFLKITGIAVHMTNAFGLSVTEL